MKQWYLLRCKPKRDAQAKVNLESQGWNCFAPYIKIRKSRNGKTKCYTEPLFPGYIFIQLDNNVSWVSVNSTRGVQGVIKFGSYPLPVQDEVIDELTGQVPNIEMYLSLPKEFKQGTPVCIKQGCFSGLEAIYKSKSGTERSIILIQFLGESREVRINNEYLESA